MKRDNGFYWVKWDGLWLIAEYVQGEWYVTQRLSYLDDTDLEEIDERRIERIEEEKKLCQHCQKNEANPDHVCPYASEINNNEESLCNCCEECMNQCAMDI